MRYTVLSFLCASAVIAYVQRSAISVPARRIQGELSLDSSEMGLVMGAWYLGYAVLQIPSGWLADRLGSKRVLIVASLAWSLLTGLMGIANGFLGLVAIWFSMGMAQAAIFPCATKAIGGWFPGPTRAIASGFLIVAQLAGAAAAPWLTGRLLPHMDWRTIFLLYALPGFLWAAAFWWFVPRRPGSEVTSKAAVDWGKLVRSRSMQLLVAQQFLRGAAMAFFFSWFPKFLQEVFKVNESDAGRLTMWPGIGAMAGALLGGIASDALLRLTHRPRLARQGTAVLGMLGCSLLTFACLAATDVSSLILLFSIAVFWGTFGGVSGYAVAIAFGGSRVGIVFAVMNTGGNIGASLFPPLLGWALDRTGNWDLAIIAFAILFLLDGVLWAFLNPRQPLYEDES